MTQSHSLLDTERSVLSELFFAWAHRKPTEIKPLALSGSGRRYFRLRSGELSAIGAINPSIRENEAFVAFARHFGQRGISVPEILGYDARAGIYLQQDLGDESLMDHLLANRSGSLPDPATLELYRQSLEELAQMQIAAEEGLDYSLCFPTASLDAQSFRWDLNTFKYYFLRPSEIPYDEAGLEDDFRNLAEWLETERSDFFCLRDFQSRNIMVQEGRPWFIDFQGGRKGALQYDLVSLLYQARAALPQQLRDDLLDHYLGVAGKLTTLDEPAFRGYFRGFLLVRLLQVLGTYGFRGRMQKKAHFIQSIPFALQNLRDWLKGEALPIDLPVLIPAIERLLAVSVEENEPATEGLLRVRIQSFSFKRGLPEDKTVHGGGYIFDCRALLNPGRYEPYKALTGKDESVIRFLREKSKIGHYLKEVFALVDEHVSVFRERGFDYLSVSFGCTGGQHRSVYCAEQLAKRLQGIEGLHVELSHREEAHWP